MYYFRCHEKNNFSKNHTDIFYFKKSEYASDFFKILDPVLQNWRSVYVNLVKENKPDYFNLNLLVNIALKMFGHTDIINDHFLYTFLSLENVDLDDHDLPEDWTRYLSCWVKDKKVKFFKTHNVFGKINNNPFTNKENSLGCIYIIRDPRNVITSLSNHYELNYDDSLAWMTNHKKYIFDNRGGKDYGNFQFISSWSNNYKSWKIQKDLPIKIIRYEDLLEKTFSVTKEIILFVNKVSKNNEKVDTQKLRNSVNSTSFNRLKTNEQKEGFAEAIFSKKQNKMIPFFNLGPKNNWKNILDEDFANKLYEIFKDDLNQFKYSK